MTTSNKNASKKKKPPLLKIVLWALLIFAGLQIFTDGEFGEDLADFWEDICLSFSDTVPDDYSRPSTAPSYGASIPSSSATVPSTSATQPPEEERLPSVPEELKKHVYLDARGNGTCDDFTGNVALYVIFVNDPQCSWTDWEIAEIQSKINSSLATISSDAASYGASLNLTAQYCTANVSTELVRDKSIDWVNSALASLSLPTDGTANLVLEDTLGCEEVPIVFFTNQGGRSFAQNHYKMNAVEYSIIYDEPTPLYHEVAHIFGAKDFYFPDEVQTLAEEHLPNSIMVNSGTGVIDDLTAYLIGWTDTLSDAALTFLQETAYLTYDYLAEKKEIDSYTGFVTDRNTSSGTYTGYLVDGFFHGKGKMVWNSGGSYDGDWNHGKIHGNGTYIYSDGGKYVGQFQNSKRHNYGTYYFPNGAVYDGQWVNGERTGYGTMRWSNGDVYEGQWQNSKRNGQGTLTYADGAVYTGPWVDNERSGQGTLTYADGSVYTGSWVGNERSGQGTLTLAGGGNYVGGFLHNKYHGSGTFIYNDGGKYEGQFYEGKRHGQGIYYFPSGNVYEGEWLDGERTGYGTFRWTDGTVHQGQWLNGKRHGEGTLTYPDGRVRSGLWEDDKFIS